MLYFFKILVWKKKEVFTPKFLQFLMSTLKYSVTHTLGQFPFELLECALNGAALKDCPQATTGPESTGKCSIGSSQFHLLHKLH